MFLNVIIYIEFKLKPLKFTKNYKAVNIYINFVFLPYLRRNISCF